MTAIHRTLRLSRPRCPPISFHPRHRAGPRGSCQQYATAAAPTVPHLTVRDVIDSHQRHHVRDVHAQLQNQGILKITLNFCDKESQYLENLIKGLGSNHGHGPPITHSASRGWYWDVRPSKDTLLPMSTQARSETMREFPWHTDCSYEHNPPEYFALQVLQPDRCGGGTLSVLKIDHLTRYLSGAAKAALFEPEFRITIPPEFVKEPNKLHILGSILSTDEDHSTLMRFREDIVTPVSTRAASALEELKDALKHLEASSQAVLHLEPSVLPENSIILLNNRRWLHARNNVKDPRRHLRRVRWSAVPFSNSISSGMIAGSEGEEK
ncbi:unnamed protein product [Penicillium salamii]|uniref:TauD/TfdA-like domain-containing protein n=1 Tax=Penicillium salamii TaxID=1612424 RepID=A0A9W4NAG6_9EURO|nr:unnamed protein product [Penicillium salamii]CAG8044679.1 unnamed protein product [Penicillium salamii]CAG8335383.1 unnamed protein product [Penicillium salamii]CAG8335620.1 unnamed protein product [Penicillium salamii]CAG8344026.1 unnamed protein product [Penicillium salamii]